jgi:DMSO/TMAO reductase YedYZ molybdopterin-dependent catalytic subunit
MFRRILPVLVIVTLSAVSQRSAAQTRPHGGTLIVVVDASKPLTLRPADLATMPRKTITLKQPDGRAVTHEGVLVGELLQRAGAPLGKALRGDAMATYVVASATDGYRVIFSLAELDPEFTGSEIIVADRTNGQPLLADQGPIRIIAPKDLAGARSIRMLERIEVVRLPKP